MIGNMIADTFIKPFQSPVFDDPKNYDLTYEDVTFKAKDHVELSGWLIKGSKEKVIIQSHFGVQCSRSGFTLKGKGFIKGFDKDIQFLRQAKYLNDAGYTVLMYDFRNHGNSGLGTLPWISWGLEEAKDVIAAVDFIASHKDYMEASIGLLSICMGQGASMMAFGMEDGLKQYANLRTMISVQPMDYACFIKAMKLPGFLANRTARSIRKRTGMDYNTTSWRPFVKTVSVPTLIIQNENDGFLNEAFVKGVYNDLDVQKDIQWVNMPKQKTAMKNRMAAYDWIGTNPIPVLDWFGTHMKLASIRKIYDEPV